MAMKANLEALEPTKTRIKHLSERLTSLRQGFATLNVDEVTRIIDDIEVTSQPLKQIYATTQYEHLESADPRRRHLDVVKQQGLNLEALIATIRHEARQYYREQAMHDIRIIDPEADQTSIDKMGLKPGAVFAQSLLRADARGVQQSLNQVQQRHRKIQQVEEDMCYLASVFQTVGEKVQAQDALIGRVEERIEETKDNTHAASVELDAATEKAEAARKHKKQIVIGITVFTGLVIVAGLIFLLYLFYKKP